MVSIKGQWSVGDVRSQYERSQVSMRGQIPVTGVVKGFLPVRIHNRDLDPDPTGIKLTSRDPIAAPFIWYQNYTNILTY